ncbi:outer membrane lipoprotein-sorting protein [Panacagrimonas perspica]|uniref:Outer membrane lipoprotein-sorting protein n=1 Tax=Panacagrimonas perspica TaxID=381431 RepID=A0A4V3F5D7_9GAMM|nr:outer membrane lipoprotein-sorting protein [Panacagrimonas perspica]TDU28466.1 outer membrane lipoprotein-sorting protein [Panacagrimonas perspica]
MQRLVDPPGELQRDASADAPRRPQRVARVRLRAFALAAVAVLTCTAAMEVTTQTPIVKTLECMRANTPRQLSVSELHIEAEGAGVTNRTLTGAFYSRRDERGLRAALHITAPADLAGMRYLLVEDDAQDALYLYLPALGKVRRLSGVGPESEIAGTTLNYADLRLISQALAASSITMDAPATVAGRPAHQLRFVPAVADSPYRRVIAAVDKESCAILRADFQNADRTVKQYEVDPASLIRAGAYTYASRATVVDSVRGTRAELSLRGVNTSPKLASRLFDPKTFQK